MNRIKDQETRLRMRNAEISSTGIFLFANGDGGCSGYAVFGALTKFERKLVEKQDVLTTRGKGHRGVPILVPDAAKAGLAYIACSQIRQSLGINSKYLFGNEFRLYECLANECEKAELIYPQHINVTALRQFMATVTQALDLKPHQIEWVMRHMGHSLDVHKIYYRSTSDIIERTQVAKILLLQDSGRLDEFANQSLEDIQLLELAEEVNATSSADDVPLEELFKASENMDVDEDIPVDGTNLTQRQDIHSAKKNSASSRQKLSSDEEEEIVQLFEKFFQEKRRPTPNYCLKAIRKSKTHGGVLHLRKKDVLMIDNLK